jgi:hypothetical protein
MATIGTLKTLLDWAKELDPDGSTAAVAELLSQNNGIVRTMMMQQGNLPTGHRVTQRTGLPASYWRLMNQGTPSSKATTAQVDEQCGTLTSRSEIDRKIVELNGNASSYRLSQAKAHMEGMNQEFAQTMIYGTASAPEEFIGLAARYSALTGSIGQNVISAGGSGSVNSSVYLIGWGDNTIYGIYPKGSNAGLVHEDLGLIDAFDASNNRFRAYADTFEWDGGLAIEDWRYGVRICNIDMTDLAGQSGTQEVADATALIKVMARAIDRLQNLSGVNPVFYCNRKVASFLRIAALDKSNGAVTIEPAINQFGKTIFETRFLGIPVEIEDSIVNTETTVS